MDQALPSRNPGIWMVTIAIILFGAVILLATNSQRVRARQSAVEAVPIDAPASRLTQVLEAEPRVCPVDDLGHLAESFPEGWSPAGIDVAIEALEARTAERWLYGVDAPPDSCAPQRNQTEIGVDSAGAIVWSIPVVGRSPIRLPSWVEPAGTQDTTEAP